MTMAVTSIHRNMSVPSLYSVSSRERIQVSKTVPPVVDSKENDIIVINIAGKRFETYLSTLKRFPNSLLGDPDKRIHFYNKITGEYFFDRSRKAFNGILYFYQSNGVLERPEGVSESIFSQEVIFFELAENALEFNEQTHKSDQDDSLPLPTNPFLSTIWVLFERPTSSIFARILAILSVVIIVLSISVFCLETIPDLNPDTKDGKYMKETWFILNTVCNVWFTLEYVLRLISSPNKILFVRSTLNIVDLLSILPYYFNVILGASGGGNKLAVLRVIRVIRVIRIFKLTRHSRGLHILANTVKASSHELAMLMLFLAIGVILFSSAVYFAESEKNESGFKSIPHGFWWAVVTMTTVGYGDLYPATFLGKLIGTLCAVSGVLVIALPVPVIVSNFEYYYKEEQNRQARENEILKQSKLDEALPTIRGSMKMMTDTSIILAGGKSKDDSTSENPRKKLKDRFHTQFSFSMRQPLSDDFDRSAREELNGNSSMVINAPNSTQITCNNTVNNACVHTHICSDPIEIESCI
ncbi:potassium voltage-gated channel subfamily A member 2-like isoform X2 [Hydractinia symbiolongicarpus]|nr:potassium voltage-gated channel subfamily A member 2-like isoform X2 [Hydractinia symbiolongicarpus]